MFFGVDHVRPLKKMMKPSSAAAQKLEDEQETDGSSTP
jgi:hypothetical protein